MAGRLASKTAIITGSSSGIGRAIALRFAHEGANIVCSDIREDPRPKGGETSSTPTTSEIKNFGGKSIFVECDTSKADGVEALVSKAAAEFGRVDIMVNNAGVALRDMPIWQTPEDGWDHVQAVNLKGVFLGTKYASLRMKDQEPHASGDRGWIINVASVLGLGGTRGGEIAAYVASKHGVMGLTKTAAWDCAPLRIHVNALCPGFSESAMTSWFIHDPAYRSRLEALHPFRGLGHPEDLAKAAVFLASEDAQWVTGIGLPVDGGYSSM